jgi:DNA-binding beta-propeller fold protein YncE
MTRKILLTLTLLALLSGPSHALAQTTVSSGPMIIQEPPRPPAPKLAPGARRPKPDNFRPRARELLYVTEPGSIEQPGWHNGVGIIVLDVSHDWAFVKRIPTWDYAGSMSPEQVSGVAASPVTNQIYLAARGRIGAFDMATDKMAWSTRLDGECCERPQVTPDGRFIIVGSDLLDYWYKLDARTGKLLAKIMAPQSRNAHNLNLSADGKLAFMSPNGKVLSIADIETAKTIKTIAFPDNVRVFVLNNDSSRIYANNNNFMGYMVADVATGKIVQTVEVTSVDWRSRWNAEVSRKTPHNCPSHGVAITPDGKEIWVSDGLFNKIHIFANTDAPKEIDTIDSVAGRGPFWLTFGLDEKYAYASSGEIIDIKTHKIVGVMKDEYGRPIYSEKLLDIQFDNGHAQRVSNQFANQFGDLTTAEERGVGPHVTPLPGSAPHIATSTGPDPNSGLAPDEE